MRLNLVLLVCALALDKSRLVRRAAAEPEPAINSPSSDMPVKVNSWWGGSDDETPEKTDDKSDTPEEDPADDGNGYGIQVDVFFSSRNVVVERINRMHSWFGGAFKGINYFAHGYIQDRVIDHVGDTLVNTMQRKLAVNGIISRIEYITKTYQEKQAISFFIRLEGLFASQFEKSQMASIKSGVVSALTDDNEELGQVPFATVLEESGVYGCMADVGEDTATTKNNRVFDIFMKCEKGKLLAEFVGNKYLATLLRKTGYTNSEEIAVEAGKQIREKMLEKFKENGVLTQITAEPWEGVNGEHDHEDNAGHKMIAVKISVELEGILPEQLFRGTRAMIRDGVVAKLADPGEGGLVGNLEAEGVACDAVITPCGVWPGPNPLADAERDPKVLPCIPREEYSKKGGILDNQPKQ